MIKSTNADIFYLCFLNGKKGIKIIEINVYGGGCKIKLSRSSLDS
jgi:hypothetical protein